MKQEWQRASMLYSSERLMRLLIRDMCVKAMIGFIDGVSQTVPAIPK